MDTSPYTTRSAGPHHLGVRPQWMTGIEIAVVVRKVAAGYFDPDLVPDSKRLLVAPLSNAYASALPGSIGSSFSSEFLELARMIPLLTLIARPSLTRVPGILGISPPDLPAHPVYFSHPLSSLENKFSPAARPRPAAREQVTSHIIAIAAAVATEDQLLGTRISLSLERSTLTTNTPTNNRSLQGVMLLRIIAAVSVTVLAVTGCLC